MFFIQISISIICAGSSVKSSVIYNYLSLLDLMIRVLKLSTEYIQKIVHFLHIMPIKNLTFILPLYRNIMFYNYTIICVLSIKIRLFQGNNIFTVLFRFTVRNTSSNNRYYIELSFLQLYSVRTLKVSKIYL